MITNKKNNMNSGINTDLDIQIYQYIWHHLTTV